MQVKDFNKYEIREDGTIVGPKRTLRPFVGRGGYLKVCLKQKPKSRWVYVHRLVCETFIDNPLGKKEINHKDGNKFNNNVCNLEWVTRSENGLHAHKSGLNVAVRGERVGSHKLTAQDVVRIRAMKGLKTLTELRKEYGISRQHLCNIQSGKYWKQEAANV